MPDARDPLAPKRVRLAELMHAAGKDSPTFERDIRSLPESQLDYVISYYGGGGSLGGPKNAGETSWDGSFC
jgi:hypothetical protein